MEIENWRLFDAIERGNILYEFKSDNIIEIIFSGAKESRTYGTPYFVLHSIITENIKRMSNLFLKNVVQNTGGRERALGLTTR